MADAKIDVLLQIRSDLEGLKAAQRESKNLKSSLGGIGSSLAGAARVLGAVGIVQTLVQGVSAGVRFNAMVETQTVAFETLLGSVAAADERIKGLINFAATTPFQLGEVTQANKLLQSLTQGALASEDGMRLVGDAAAAVGVPFQDAAFWIGRLYSGLEGGAPIGEAATRLQEMGLVSSEVRGELNELSGSALGTTEATELMGRIFEKTSGSMAKQAQTLNGRISTLKDGINQLLGGLTEDTTAYLSELVNGLNILLGNSQTAAQAAASSIKLIGKELLEMEDSATTESVSVLLEKLATEADVARESISEAEAKLKELEAKGNSITPSNQNSNFEFDADAARISKEITAEREVLNAKIAESKKLLEDISAIQQRATSENAKARQTERSEEKAAADAAVAKALDIETRTKAAKDENEKLTESVKKLNDQFLDAVLNDQEKIELIGIKLKAIEEETNAEFKKAELIESADQRKAVQDNIQLKAEQERIPLLIEQIKLEEKLAKAKTEDGEKAIKFQAQIIELQIDQIKHEKELAEINGDSATSRAIVAGLVEKEKELLGGLVTLWQNYAATVTDPAVRLGIEATIQGLKQQQSLAGTGSETPSLLQQSTDGIDSLSDPSQSFQSVSEAAIASLQDYQVQLGTISDQFYDSFTSIQESLNGGIADSIEGLIKGTLTWKGAFEQVGEAVLNTVVSAFATMLANWITTQLTMLILGKVFGKTAAVGSIAQAAALTAAWTPAATAVSIATFGAAAAVGTAATIAGMGAATITGVATSIAGGASGVGFASGGYTGPGSVSQVKGYVHAEEFVTPADVVRKAGGPNFFADQMNSIREGRSQNSGPSQVIVVDDRATAQRLLESSEGQAMIMDIVENNKSRLL
jgi:hypothetical protein